MKKENYKPFLFQQVLNNSKKIRKEYFMLGIVEYVGDISDYMLVRLANRVERFYSEHAVDLNDLFYAVSRLYEEHLRLTDDNIMSHLPL